jgi:hypothetical protein
LAALPYSRHRSPPRRLVDPPNAGDTITASVALVTLPGSEVDAGSALKLSPATLTFTADNYDSGRVISVTLNSGDPPAGLVRFSVELRLTSAKDPTWNAGGEADNSVAGVLGSGKLQKTARRCRLVALAACEAGRLQG